jgi:hypothetical protein
MGFAQLEQSLHAGNQQDDQMTVSSTKAHALLAARGFDASGLTRDLDQIELQASFESQSPMLPTDVHGYLRHRHEMIICNAIDTNRTLTNRQFKESVSDYSKDDWAATKHKLRSEYRRRAVVVEPDNTPMMIEAGDQSTFYNGITNTPMTNTMRTPMRTPMSSIHPHSVSRSVQAQNSSRREQHEKVLYRYYEKLDEINKDTARKPEHKEIGNAVYEFCKVVAPIPPLPLFSPLSHPSPSLQGGREHAGHAQELRPVLEAAAEHAWQK